MSNLDVQAPQEPLFAAGDVSRLVETVREAERHVLARELHDTVIQPLVSLVISLRGSEEPLVAGGAPDDRVEIWRQLAQEALDSLRRTLAGLHTHPHAYLGLPEAIRRYLTPRLWSRGIALRLDVRAWPADLPVEYTSGLYLTIREALANVEKHSRATEVSVCLRREAGLLSVLVADNGAGFPVGSTGRPASPGDARSGFGLGFMRERVQILGGSLCVVSVPEHGTRIVIRIPGPDRAGATQRSTYLDELRPARHRTAFTH
jgi:NarL family two-component system sensor histidine kinase LiaS